MWLFLHSIQPSSLLALSSWAQSKQDIQCNQQIAAAGSQIGVLTVRVNALHIININCYTLSSYSNCCHQVSFGLAGGSCLFFSFISSLFSLGLLFSFPSQNCYLHVQLATFPADSFTGTQGPLGVPPISSGWTVKKRTAAARFDKTVSRQWACIQVRRMMVELLSCFWATARGRRVLESVLYHAAFKKQNVLPERARAERTDSAFSWNDELLRRNFWTEWTHEGDIKAAAYSYIQWKVSIVSFLSLPWKLLTNVWVRYASSKY